MEVVPGVVIVEVVPGVVIVDVVPGVVEFTNSQRA